MLHGLYTYRKRHKSSYQYLVPSSDRVTEIPFTWLMFMKTVTNLLKQQLINHYKNQNKW